MPGLRDPKLLPPAGPPPPGLPTLGRPPLGPEGLVLGRHRLLFAVGAGVGAGAGLGDREGPPGLKGTAPFLAAVGAGAGEERGIVRYEPAGSPMGYGAKYVDTILGD